MSDLRSMGLSQLALGLSEHLPLAKTLAEIARREEVWRQIESKLRHVPEGYGADVIDYCNECLHILDGAE